MPLGTNPVAPLEKFRNASPDSGGSSEAFGSGSTSTSLARPHGSPSTAFTFEEARENPDPCATAPLANEATSNTIRIVRATVSGGIFASRQTRGEIRCGTFFSGARTCHHAASARNTAATATNTFSSRKPWIEGGLSFHGTPKLETHHH